ncbi:MAG: hypothetical protein AMXMBFR47_00270 [Planctomycetota bacterium]
MRSVEHTYTVLRQRFPDVGFEVVPAAVHPHIVVPADAWRPVAECLRTDADLGFNLLRCLSGVDQLEDGLMSVWYDLHRIDRPAGDAAALWPLEGEIAIRVNVPRADPKLASVSDLWPAAEWHEREAYDLLGIVFEGNPDLRRILCCDDWVGYPLRKDYEFPLEYRGIPAVTELGQTRPQH